MSQRKQMKLEVMHLYKKNQEESGHEHDRSACGWMLNHQYRIAVDRAEHMIATTRKLKLEDGLVMEGEFPVRKFSIRKWSGSGQEMAAFIWSHHFDALFSRMRVNRGKLQSVCYCAGPQQRAGIALLARDAI
jgi:hypothetical protein